MVLDEDNYVVQGHAVIADLRHRAGRYASGSSATLLCGRPGCAVRRVVEGDQWVAARPLVLEWFDAQCRLMERSMALTRSVYALQDLYRSPDCMTEAHTELIRVAVESKNVLTESYRLARIDVLNVAQRLQDLDMWVDE